jgi:hypothetical protein
MKITFASVLFAATAIAQTPGGIVNSPAAAASVGTGPYPAVSSLSLSLSLSTNPQSVNKVQTYFADPTLKNHTIYQPKTLPANVKMPLIIWSEGGCLSVGTIMMPFLVQLASQGIVIIAQGAPGNVTATFADFGTAPRSTPQMMIDAIDWAVMNAGKGDYAHLDASRIAVAGQSCGGLEAYSAGVDKRVSMYGIFNSGGNLTGTVVGGGAKSITKPVFYFLGGPTDVAYSPVS